MVTRVQRSVDLRFVIGVLLGVALTAWFFATVHWGDLWAALLGVSVPWIVLSAVTILFEFVLRTLRWRYLIRHVDEDIGFQPLFSAIVIGAALNTILPLRGGDLIRPAVLARARGLSYATVLTSTVVERVLDIFGLLTVLSLTLAFLPPELAENPVVQAFRTGGIVLVAVAVVVLVVGVVAASKGARVVVERLSRPAPARLRDRALGIYDQLAAGFEVVGQPLRILPALGITLVMWGNGLLAILCLFQAFSLDLGVVAGLFTQCGLGVIVALPQAPGYWGAFQVAVSTTMQAFGAGEGFAKASAILFWAVCFVPVTTVGLVEYWRFGRSLLQDDDDPSGEPSAVTD